MCAQEEDRLKGDKLTEVNFVKAEKGNKFTNAGSSFTAGKLKKKGISSSFKSTNASKDLTNSNLRTLKSKKKRNAIYVRKQVTREITWEGKKLNVFVCVESNLVYIPPESWWFDIGCSIHITKSL